MLLQYLTNVLAVLVANIDAAVRTKPAVPWKVCCTLWQYMMMRDIVITGGAHWVPRLLPKVAESPSAQLAEPSAVVEATWSSLLITGGLGSLGVLFTLYGLLQVCATNS